MAPGVGELLTARGAIDDVNHRVVPTLDATDRSDLTGALVALDASLAVADLAKAGTSLDLARSALARLRAAGTESPAELSAIELAFDRAGSLLPAVLGL